MRFLSQRIFNPAVFFYSIERLNLRGFAIIIIFANNALHNFSKTVRYKDSSNLKARCTKDTLVLINKKTWIEENDNIRWVTIDFNNSFFLQKSMKIFNIFRVFDMKIFKRHRFFDNRTIFLYVYKKRDFQDIEKVLK